MSKLWTPTTLVGITSLPYGAFMSASYGKPNELQMSCILIPKWAAFTLLNSLIIKSFLAKNPLKGAAFDFQNG